MMSNTPLPQNNKMSGLAAKLKLKHEQRLNAKATQWDFAVPENQENQQFCTSDRQYCDVDGMG